MARNTLTHSVGERETGTPIRKRMKLPGAPIHVATIWPT